MTCTRFSTEAPADFWSALWDFADVIGDKGDAPYIVDGDKMPGAQFFLGAHLNFAENQSGGARHLSQHG